MPVRLASESNCDKRGMGAKKKKRKTEMQERELVRREKNDPENWRQEVGSFGCLFCKGDEKIKGETKRKTRHR